MKKKNIFKIIKITLILGGLGLGAFLYFDLKNQFRIKLNSISFKISNKARKDRVKLRLKKKEEKERIKLKQSIHLSLGKVYLNCSSEFNQLCDGAPSLYYENMFCLQENKSKLSLRCSKSFERLLSENNILYKEKKFAMRFNNKCYKQLETKCSIEDSSSFFYPLYMSCYYKNFSLLNRDCQQVVQTKVTKAGVVASNLLDDIACASDLGTFCSDEGINQDFQKVQCLVGSWRKGLSRNCKEVINKHIDTINNIFIKERIRSRSRILY